MRYPKLKTPEKRRVIMDRFRGYSHNPEPGAGAFYDMENLSGEAAPLLRTRRRRTEPGSLEGCPTDRVLAIGGRGRAVVLDGDGTLWCDGAALPRLLDGTLTLEAYDQAGGNVGIPTPQLLLNRLIHPGTYYYRYEAAGNLWRAQGGSDFLSGALLEPADKQDGSVVRLVYDYRLKSSAQRELVFLGSWVCVFPDGKFANTAKLGSASAPVPGEDYGDIAQHNSCDQGGTLFTPCGPDGEARSIQWSAAAPAGGCWVDSSEPEPRLRVWSQSQGLWTELAPYVKCAIPGIAKGLRAGDSVELFCRLESNQGPEPLLNVLWDGTHVLTGAWHDPGGAGREEGRGDYLILPLLLPEPCELELTWHDRSYFSVDRPMPEMDFVVEAGNRLWGCRSNGSVNELYGSKLGDFRCWSAFEGLSTDSYRVSRGHDGPYTGAAVLGGCPLFFRADSLEKIYPAADGAHGVVTVSLEGIEAGSAKSAVVIRDRLYYKSPAGICCYNGTLPLRISAALGETRYHKAAAGARGSRYYVSMEDEAGAASLFVLDTDTGLWHREDGQRFCAAWSKEELLWLLPAPDQRLICVGQTRDSRDVRWWAETGELAPRLAAQRYVTRLQVEARLDPGAVMRVYLSFDGGPWLRRGELRGNSLRAVTLPIFPRRCQRLRLRLEGSGGMELHSLSWLTEAGSDV